MSVQGGTFWDETFVAATSASLASAQFTAVSLSSGAGSAGLSPIAGQLPVVILTTSSTNGPNGAVGILQNDPKGGQAAIVRHLGTSKLVATTSAAVTIGSLVTLNATGQGCIADTTGQRVIGQCIAGSTTLVAGALIEVLMQPRPIFFA